MATLTDLVNDTTDKNTTHSYLDLYEKLLSPIKEKATSVLEVGIGDFNEKNGGSILLWRDYFTNATIHGLDILPKERVFDELLTDERVVLYTETNAYDPEFVKKTFVDTDMKFDFLLDDGPHTLKSMMDFIKLYSPLMKDDGILIIEDVQSISWFDALVELTPDHLKEYIKAYDLRQNKGRYDDLVFVIDKRP
jgi:hypothetical protein